MGFVVGDLTDSDTDQRIEYGGQIADLVTLVVYIRVSERNAVQAQPEQVPMPTVVPCEEDPACSYIISRNEEFEESQRNLLAGTPVNILDRTGNPIS